MNSKNVVLQACNLTKTYDDGQWVVQVLQDINLTVSVGDQIAIIGPSGSGKSTLLHLLGGLDKPSSGEVLVEGQDIWSYSEAGRSRLRNQLLGFVYQFHHLLPEFTALENTAMPLLLGRKNIDEAKADARIILEKAGLSERLCHKPSQLSGGERQRVAIARAMAAKPRCILADEPTGNLDQKTAESVYSLLLDLNRSIQTSLIIVTHDEKLAKKMDKVFVLSEGQLNPA